MKIIIGHGRKLSDDHISQAFVESVFSIHLLYPLEKKEARSNLVQS